MKELLFVYDRMMVGGTTTALLALLNSIDYSKYSVDLLLYDSNGPYMKFVPQKTYVLTSAHKENKIMSSSYKKIMLSLFNGNIFRALCSYFKYKNTAKGNLRSILYHYSFKAQVALSRKLDKHYDAAIGFIEGWSDHYVLSNKVKADKKIIWIHPDYKDSYLIPEADMKAFNKADAIVMVSSRCKNNFDKIFPQFSNKSQVIQNINSCELIRKRANEPLNFTNRARVNICTVCRCDMKVKGLDRILLALTRLKQENMIEDVIWHLVGAGPDLEELKNQISFNKLNENIVLYGDVLNPLPLLSCMDVFVLASRYEGKPVSIDEAMSLGVPCVVTEYASAHEQIKNGYNGIVVPNDDSSIYYGLKKIITDDQLRNEMKRNLEESSPDNSYVIKDFYNLLGD